MHTSPLFSRLAKLSAVVALIAIASPVQAQDADAAKGAKGKPASISILGGMGTLSVPAEFKVTEPKNRIIEHEFKVAKDDSGTSTARLTMMAAGGDVAQNIARWKGQFSGGDADAQKSEKMTVGSWEVHIVDCSGEFAERMGGGPFAPGKTIMRKDYAMAGAILVEPKGRKFFVKMIGPADVVKANRDEFVKMIKEIK